MLFPYKELRFASMNKVLKTRFASVMIVVLCASLAAPAFAGAQQVDPTTSQYGDKLSEIQVGGAPQGGDPPSDDGLGGRVGPLPFTGFDVIAMAAVALAVTGLGLALQRAVSRPQE
jgi:hypothetical protein